MELEKAINIQADIEIIDSRFNEFMRDNLKKGNENIKYNIAYNLEKSRYEIKINEKEYFIEEIQPALEKGRHLDLINDFSKQNSVSIDYFMKKNLLAIMNHE
jgi:hypothetical protein